MILMLDNYDSFTYNLVQYLGELEAEVHVVRNDQVTVEDIEDMKPAGVVVSPGPCSPDEAGVSIELIQRLAHRLPIFGVCGPPGPGPGLRGKSGSCARSHARQDVGDPP